MLWKNELVLIVLTEKDFFRWLLKDVPSLHPPSPEEALHLESLKTELGANFWCLGRRGTCLTRTRARAGTKGRSGGDVLAFVWPALDLCSSEALLSAFPLLCYCCSHDFETAAPNFPNI